MIEDSSPLENPAKNINSLQEHQNKNKQLPFNKIVGISFVKIGNCHMCKSRNKIVYQCHKNYIATSCEKKFCLDCLVLIYKDNIVMHIQTSDSWKCPYHRKICRCKNCCANRKQLYGILQFDNNMPVYMNLRLKARTEQQEQDPQIDENTKCLLKEKFKKVLEMNGQLIGKVNVHYHKLSEQQIKFYNKLIHSNLKVMNHMAQNMIAHQALIQQQ